MDKPDKSTSYVDLNGYDRETQQLGKNERRMERVSSILAIFLRILTFVLQSANPILCLLIRFRIAIAASAARCLEQYYQAASGLWLDGTMTYPTILNLVAALVIIIFNSIALCAYIRGKALLEKWLTHEGLANIIQTTLCTIASGIMLGTSSNSNSIEGQACQGAQQNASGMNTICELQVYPLTPLWGGRC